MSQPNRDKQAVILSGGGAYGAYEVGVLKAMLTGQMPQTGFERIDPDIYTGTSVGAINAAVMVSQSGLGVSGADAIGFLENAWLSLIAETPKSCGNGAFRIRADLFNYFNPKCLTNPARSFAELGEDSAYLAQSLFSRTLNFFNSPGNIPTRALEFVDLSAFVSSDPINRLVREIISLEAIRKSPKKLQTVAANWSNGEMRVFENDDLPDEYGYEAVLASAAIPGFFPPRYIGGEPYVDGGVVSNTPLKPSIQAGAAVLHIIYLDPDLSQLPLKVLQNTYNTLDRTVLIHNAMVIEEDVATAKWINEGIDVLERVRNGEELSDASIRSFVRVAAQIEKRLKQGLSYKKITIHRYHPHYDPGGGGVGILNFNRDRMMRLIELGFNDTIYHDCDQSECVLQ